MKSNVKFIVFLSIFFAITSCGVTKKPHTNQIKDKEVTILAVNDMHAGIERFPRFAFIVDSLRNIYPDILLFAAGDNQTGHPVNDQYMPKGVPMMELMNQIKFNLSAIGNHEFDAGEQGFSLLSNMCNFNFVCSNITTPESPKFNIKPYKIFNLPNKVKIGVAALIQINNKGIPDCNPSFAENFKFTDPYITAQEYVNMKDSCDLLIFVNHLGIDGDIKLAEQLPANSADLIIGGHSHTLIDKDNFTNGIRIVQAGRDLKNATLIKLKIKPNGKVESTASIIPIGKKGDENKKVKTMVHNYMTNNPFLTREIASAEDNFTTKEQIGYLMTDALYSYEPMDFAFINSGGVRIEYLEKGILAPMDVFKMDPFGNEIVIINLTGEEIYNFYKAAFHADEYRIVYATGLNSVYTIEGPLGEELKNIELFTPDNKPLDLNKTYKVAMNSYVIAATKFNHKDKGENKFVTTADNMINFFKNQKVIKSYKNEKRVEVK